MCNVDKMSESHVSVDGKVESLEEFEVKIYDGELKNATDVTIYITQNDSLTLESTFDELFKVKIQNLQCYIDFGWIEFGKVEEVLSTMRSFFVTHKSLQLFKLTYTCVQDGYNKTSSMIFERGENRGKEKFDAEVGSIFPSRTIVKKKSPSKASSSRSSRRRSPRKVASPLKVPTQRVPRKVASPSKASSSRSPRRRTYKSPARKRVCFEKLTNKQLKKIFNAKMVSVKQNYGGVRSTSRKDMKGVIQITGEKAENVTISGTQVRHKMMPASVDAILRVLNDDPNSHAELYTSEVRVQTSNATMKAAPPKMWRACTYKLISGGEVVRSDVVLFFN